MDDIEQVLRSLNEKYPLVPHTDAGRLFSTVRRMKAEKEAANDHTTTCRAFTAAEMDKIIAKVHVG